MNSRTRARVSALFAAHDAVFAEADKLFEELDQVFEEARSVYPGVHVNEPDQHTVRFQPRTWRERLKLVGKFSGMAVAMLFKGNTGLTVRRRKPIK